MDLSDASEKIPSDTTFRLVAQRLNHYATPGRTSRPLAYKSEVITL